MSFFKTRKEKMLWLGIAGVLFGIYLPLIIGKEFEQIARNQNVQAAIFLAAMALIAASVIVKGISMRTTKMGLSLVLGALAVLVMLVFRIGAAERSHLIEYGVLAIFIFSALSERYTNDFTNWKIGLWSFLIAFSFGVIDELAQLLSPRRIFDFEDIVFNTMAAAGAIGVGLLINWLLLRYKSY